MGEALAIAAAIAFAVGTVLQQKGTLSTSDSDARFLVQILKKPVWLIGMLCQVLGWILQAMALDRASLVVVQSLCAMSLVVALPLGVWLTHQVAGLREISGALLTLAGLIVFLGAGQPQGGTNNPSAATWWVACIAILVLVGVLFLVGKRMSGAERAIMLGLAAGVGFGLQAAVTKTFVTEIGGGLSAILADWSVYVLVVTALTGFALQQSALKTGVLAPAMASSNASTLFSSVILGIFVYGEHLSKSGGVHPAAAIVGLLVAGAGVVLLAGAAPPKESVTPTPIPRGAASAT
jgi:drug/metabolite transporter (DMT)-like permease